MDDDLEPSDSQEEQQANEERIKRLVPLAKDVALVLVKTVRATKMYLPNNPVYQKFREELREKFDAYFESEEMLSFLVKRFEFTFLDQTVYENPDKEDNLALMFFKDGVREFCFHKGITDDEINGFIDILQVAVKSRELDDDLVTLMWEKDFQNITYTLTDEATDEEAEEEDTILSFEEEPEGLKQLDELRARSGGEDESAIDGLGGGLSVGVSAGEALGLLDTRPASKERDYEAMRGVYQPPDDLALLTELTDVFYEILLTEDDEGHFGMVADSLAKALEIFIGRGDMALATILLMKVQELAAEPRIARWSGRINAIIDYACSDTVIGKVGEFIDQGEQEAMESGGSYLRQLDARAIGPLVGLLESLNNRKARKSLCDIIVDICAGDGKPLAKSLEHRHWFVVRNIAMVLGRVADPDTVPALGGVIGHADVRVRKETLHSLAAIKGAKAEELLAESLADSDRQVRLLAGRLLAELAPERAYGKFTAIVAEKGFEDREFEEKKDIYELLGRSGGEKAVPFLAEQFGRKGIFKSQKRDRMRACAAYGLAAAGGSEAYELLKSEIDSKSKLVRAACLDGLKRAGRPQGVQSG